METVVLLFTDVEGSTRAWATSPRMVRSLERHDGLLREALAAHGGIEFKHTGDGLCATFPSVADAVAAAVDVQRALVAADWDDGPALRVRVAIHAGTAHRRGDDWFGLSLSRCARLMGAAHGGQVLVSSAARVLLSEAPVDGVSLLDLGRVGLRDFPEPEQVWQVVATGIDAAFPSLRALAPDGNLPADLSPIVGRAASIEQVRAAVGESRLVTLTGPGGVGKTRLAVAAGRALAPGLAGGVWLVELASAQSSADVDLIVVAAVGLSLGPGASPRQALISAIGGRDLLLVFDNCEHVLDGVAALTVDLLHSCGSLSILTTSREPLAVEGERTLGVPSLDIETEAIELFLARADAAAPGFVVGEDEVVREICRRLDGIPLAIELAAAMVRMLPAAEIAQRLQDHVDVVTSGRRGRIERHATVRAAIDWSWSLLNEEERSAFARLSVFAGRFDLDAVGAVIDDEGHGDSMDRVAALVDKSMVLADPSGVAPFRMLEPLRQYAAEKLAAEGGVDETARRHAEHYAAVVHRLAPQLETSDELRAVIALDSARDNLRAAFAFALAQRDLDLCLRLVSPLRGYAVSHVWAEAWSWADASLALEGAARHPLHLDALLLASRGAWQRGDLTRALALADSGLDLVVEGSDRWREVQEHRAGALVFLARLDESLSAAKASVGDPPRLDSYGDLQRMATYLLLKSAVEGPDLDAALEVLGRTKTGSVSAHALALHVAGMLLVSTDPRMAAEYQRAAVDLAAAVGATLVQGFALMALAAAEAQDNPSESVGRYSEVLAHYLRVGSHVHLREFGRAAVVALADCRSWEAAAIVEGATRDAALFELTLGASLQDAVRRIRDAIGDDYDRCAARGAALRDDELVSYVSAVASQLADART
ncbi:MAG TPA: adenylate/guanylate cyclase domain-containing protein [Acidimicrobiales bacterium]|nr:adenylate/guanylate cyclase domain-containing protein [Acidimicrobiales bacterium]